MDQSAIADIKRALLRALPKDGTTVGNIRLRKELSEALGTEIDEAEYEAARDALVDEGRVAKGRGRGGSVYLLEGQEAPSLTLASKEVPADANKPKPRQSSIPIQQRAVGQPAKPKSKGEGFEQKVVGYQHKDHRTNNPEVGLVNAEDDPGQPKTRWAYDPHIDPALQFDIGRAQVENLIDDALASGDTSVMRSALEKLKRQAEPYLNWAGKAERTSFDIDTVSLHVHERIDPATILARIKKHVKGTKVGEDASPYQQDWLREWFDRPLPLREAIEFYKHDRGWANRLIAGDSLLVMNSLLEKEGMAGQVQMIYIDPPYGIKYGSNFQPFVSKRDVKDRKDEDLTQEPEMIKAFRDTWELGIHSYLTYLRDRLLVSRELLHTSGSVFIQISDENLHHVRELCDEIFGAQNFAGLITFKKTTSSTSNLLASVSDYLVWYARSLPSMKYRQLYLNKEAGGAGGSAYNKVELPNGFRRSATSTERESSSFAGRMFRLDNLTSQSPGTRYDVELNGQNFYPKGYWKTEQSSMPRLVRSQRVAASGSNLYYVRFIDDFPAFPISNTWSDTSIAGFASDKKYVVETSTKVVERCLLMTTDPGDLVLDPTCGSGTTAFVSEKWGRRWITCDTSRVSVTLAKQRLMTSSYDYFDLKYPHEGLKAGFIYKSVPHITLKSIANNAEIENIYERRNQEVEAALSELNELLGKHTESIQWAVTEGVRKGEILNLAAGDELHAWEVPFEFPDSWPDSARSAFKVFCDARSDLQREIDKSIEAHADQEILYDQPQVSSTRMRVTGPFTVEAVPFPSVASLDAAEDAQPLEADASIARSGESARQHTWRDELMRTGIRGKGGQILKFATLETLPDTRYLHVTGTLADSGERVVVSFGPAYAALEQRQVEMAKNEAGDLFPLPKMIVFAAFAFDPEAAKDIDNIRGIVALKAQMNTDLLTEDLKKARSSNQSFWLMGQPDVELRKRKDGQYEVEVNGFDYFDTTKGELVSGGKNKIAAWALDTDYDERSLFPTQVFFPMAGKDDGWDKLRKDIKAELDESLLPKLHGTVSLPFDAGDHRQVAVKIIDDRGIESLKIIRIPLD